MLVFVEEAVFYETNIVHMKGANLLWGRHEHLDKNRNLKMTFPQWPTTAKMSDLP